MTHLRQLFTLAFLLVGTWVLAQQPTLPLTVNGYISEADGEIADYETVWILYTACGQSFVDSTGTDGNGFYTYTFLTCPQGGSIAIGVACDGDSPNMDYVASYSANMSALTINLISDCDAPDNLCDVGLEAEADNMTVSFELDYDDEANITWDFGDGTTGSGVEPTHTYQEPGYYYPCAFINDPMNMDSCYVCTYVEVGNWNSGCNVYFYAVQLDNSDVVLLPGGDFNPDLGTYSTVFSYNGISIAENSPTVSFPGPGVYDVCMTVTYDADSTVCEYCAPVWVSEPWGGDCGYIHYEQEEDLTLAFGFESFNWNPNDPFVAWDWSFGDGSTSTEENPEHSYAVQGEYYVSVLAWTASGDSCFAGAYVWAGDVWPGDCGYVYYTPVDAMTVSFGFESFEGDSIVTWVWDFGDGNSSNAANPQHTYAEAGGYYAMLTAINADGSTCSAAVYLWVGTWYEDCGYIYYEQDSDLAVEFGFEHFYPTPNDPFVSWAWDFGDGSTSTEENPEHTYAAQGDYLVQVTGVTASGDSCSASVYVWAYFYPDNGCWDDDLMNFDVACTTVYEPVCGCDGITYDNACVAENYYGITDWMPGTCNNGIVTNPNEDPFEEGCQAGFFYFADVWNIDSFSSSLLLFGWGTEADSMAWTVNGNYMGGEPFVFVPFDPNTDVQVYSVCLNTYELDDDNDSLCTVTVCESIVLDMSPDGFISGVIFEDGSGALADEWQVKSSNNINGEALANVTVELLNAMGNIVAVTVTDAEGAYSFSSLPNGDYWVHVNIEGKTHEPYHVHIAPNDPDAEGLNFAVGTESVTSGTEGLSFASSIVASPNPATDVLNLQMSLDRQAELNLTLRNVLGQNVWQQQFDGMAGFQQYEVPVAGLQSGIYILSIASGDEVYSLRIVKQ